MDVATEMVADVAVGLDVGEIAVAGKDKDVALLNDDACRAMI